jgi:hypothetical protein
MGTGEVRWWRGVNAGLAGAACAGMLVSGCRPAGPAGRGPIGWVAGTKVEVAVVTEAIRVDGVGITRAATETELVALMTSRLESELHVVLAELVPETPTTRRAVAKIVASAFAPRTRRLTGDESTILRLGGGPRFTSITPWLRGVAWGELEGPQPWRTDWFWVKEANLPEQPLLRLLVLLRLDHGTVLTERQARRDKSGFILREDRRRLQIAEQDVAAAAPFRGRILSEAIAAVVNDSIFGKDGPRVAAMLLGWRSMDTSERAAFDALAEKYAERSDADAWLVELLAGHAAIGRAFAARGTGFASETSKDELAAMEVELSEAFLRLTAAHRMNSDRPEAATRLIVVATASTNPEHGTAWEWFQRAIQADRTATNAYDRMLWATLPRWGGDEAGAVRFFRAVADAKCTRLVERIPMWLSMLLEDDPTLQREPEVAAAIFDATRVEWADSAREGASEDPATRDAMRSLALAMAFAARDVARAREALGDGNWRYVPPGSGLAAASLSEITAFVDEQDGSWGAAFAGVRSAERRGQMAVAAAQAQALLERPDLPGRVRKELERLTAIDPAVRQYEGGEAVTLVGAGAATLLQWVNGLHIAKEPTGGGLAFGYSPRSVGTGQKVLLRSVVQPGERYEVTGRVRATLAGDGRSAMVIGGITVVGRANGRVPSRGVGGSVQFALPQPVPEKSVDPWVLERTFRLEIDKTAIAMDVDGQPVQLFPTLFAPEKEWGDGLEVIGYSDHPEVTVEIVELKVRKLSR